MIIKNPQTIHFIRKQDKDLSYLDNRWRYICCGSYTKEKSTRIKNKVTCKNCLEKLKKESKK